MAWKSNSGEFRTGGKDVYIGNSRVGYVSGNEVVIRGDRYRISGGDVYRNNERVGYVCGDGDIRLNDGTLWHSDDEDDD